MAADKLFKRGGRWYAWVNGQRVSTGFTSKEAAKKRLAELEFEAADPLNAAQAKATTVGFLDDLLRSLLRKGRAQDTYDYNSEKAGHLRRLLPSLARDITHKVLETYCDRRLGEGAARATVRKELGVLGASLRLARRNGLFAKSVEEVLPDFEAPYVPKTRALDPWELVALCSALPHERAAHVAFIVASGSRWGESVRAQREDLQGGFLFLRGTKTKASKRTVPVIYPFASVLTWALRDAPEAGVLFRPWAYVARDLKVACAKAGIAAVTPNDLRRTHATWLRKAGVEPSLIGAQLGHTTSRMVELVYGRLTPESLGNLLTSRVGNDPYAVPPPPASGTVLLMGCEGGDLGVSETTGTTPETAISAGNLVGHDRLELSANGLRVLTDSAKSPTNPPETEGGGLLMGRRSVPIALAYLVEAVAAYPHAAASLVEFALNA